MAAHEIINLALEKHPGECAIVMKDFAGVDRSEGKDVYGKRLVDGVMGNYPRVKASTP